MSCYQCDDATFDVLAEVATRPYQIGGSGWSVAILDHRPGMLAEWHDAHAVGDNPEDTIGRVLALANARSVQARYDDASHVGPAHTYAYNMRPRRFSPVEILKICGCYDYQACEDPQYEASLACAIVNAIRHAMIAKLPGYEAAPWGVREDDAPIPATSRMMVHPVAPVERPTIASLRDKAQFTLTLVRS